MSIRTSKLVKNMAKTLGLIVALGSVGCGSDSDGTAGTPGTGGTAGTGGSGGTGGTTGKGLAQLRVIHASPDAPNVDVYIKGDATPVIENLAYGDATEYLEVPAANYVFEIRAAGSEADSDPAYTAPALDLAADKSYSAVAAGMLGSTDLGDHFRVVALADDFGAASAGNARVRILHAGTDAPPVDIDVGNDGSSEIEMLSRFDATDTAGVELPADTALQIGILSSGAPVTAFTTPALGEGAEILVIATGLTAREPRENEGFSLLAVLPDGSTAFIRQNPIVYALHASTDAGAVDVWVGDNEIIDNIAFGGLAKIQVPAGSYDLEFFAGHSGPTLKPGTPPVAMATTPDLEAGQEYLVVANGLLLAQPSTFQLTPYQDGFALDGTARVRAVHASPNAPAVDVSTIEGQSLTTPPLVSNIAFTHATDPEGSALPEGSYTIGVAPTGSVSPVASFDISLTQGQRAWVVAAGMLGSSPNGFRLLVIDASLPEWSVASVLPK